MPISARSTLHLLLTGAVGRRGAHATAGRMTHHTHELMSQITEDLLLLSNEHLCKRSRIRSNCCRFAISVFQKRAVESHLGLAYGGDGCVCHLLITAHCQNLDNMDASQRNEECGKCVHCCIREWLKAEPVTHGRHKTVLLLGFVAGYALRCDPHARQLQPTTSSMTHTRDNPSAG